MWFIEALDEVTREIQTPIGRLSLQLENLKSFGDKYPKMIAAFRFDIPTEKYQLVISHRFRQDLAELHGVAIETFVPEIEFHPRIQLKDALDDYVKTHEDAIKQIRDNVQCGPQIIIKQPEEVPGVFPLPILEEDEIFDIFLQSMWLPQCEYMDKKVEKELRKSMAYSVYATKYHLKNLWNSVLNWVWRTLRSIFNF